MATETRAMIERTASIYMLDQPSETEINAYVSRIESGSLTLASAIEEVSVISNRAEATDPLARMFFLLFDRAPDPVLFSAAMTSLRGGATLEQIAETGLRYSGLGSDSLQKISDSAFIDRLADKIWNSPPNGFNPNVFVDLLTTMTRAEILAAACRYTDATVTYANKLDPALIYLVAADRQATSEELEQAAAKTSLNLIRDILVEADEDPYAGKPYWMIAGNTLLMKGSYTEDLTIDAMTDSAELGDSSDFQMIITRDGGSTESTVTFRTSLLNDITRLDARQIDAASSGTMTLVGATTSFAGPMDSSISGSISNDSLTGNVGNDTLVATSGYDNLTGGQGDDVFKFASPETYNNNSFTTVNDFGSGADALDLSSTFGNSEPAAATVLSGVSDPSSTDFPALNTLGRDQVVVIEHAGIWPTTVIDSPQISSGTLTARTQTQIYDLFSNIAFDTIETRGARYVVISTDQVNGGDVWLIENLTDLSTIESSEITKIGHIDSDNPDLFTLLSANGSILG